MDQKEENKKAVGEDGGGKLHHPNISTMKPVSEDAYGGGMYGHDDNPPAQEQGKLPASVTQSADGPAEVTIEPKHKPPPSSGDRDIDITGQSYIQ